MADGLTLTPSLKELTALIREHPHWPELLAKMQAPPPPSFKPSKEHKPLDELGAAYAYWCGEKNRAEYIQAIFGVLPK